MPIYKTGTKNALSPHLLLTGVMKQLFARKTLGAAWVKVPVAPVTPAALGPGQRGLCQLVTRSLLGLPEGWVVESMQPLLCHHACVTKISGHAVVPKQAHEVCGFLGPPDRQNMSSSWAWAEATEWQPAPSPELRVT